MINNGQYYNEWTFLANTKADFQGEPMTYKTDANAPAATLTQILANSITHGIGVGLSIAGLVVLIVRAVRQGNGWFLGSYIVFGISLIVLYLASTMYHSLANLPIKAFLQRLDHSAILVLIAGTYTPFLLTQLRNGLGWTVFGIVWGISIIVLVLKLVLRSRFEKPPVLLYLLLGWMGALIFLNTFRKMGALSIWFLLIGGLFYSAGVIFYRWKNLPFNHAIWHVFVMLGSTFHYFSILYLT
jgi:hemolysin III